MQIQLLTNQPNIKSGFFAAKKNEKKQEEKNTAVIDSSAKKETKKTGSAIAIASISAVCGLFILSRSFQKNANIFLNKIRKSLKKKSEHSMLKDSNKKKSFYDFFLKSTNSFIKKSESINNITSLKDVLFMKLMYKTKPTKKLHESISKFFEKISQKTVLDSYNKTEQYLSRMNRIFDELDEYIIKNSGDEKIKIDGTELTKKEWIKEAKGMRDIANIAVNAVINKNTVKYRFDYINDVTSSLYSTFWDASFKDFWSKNNKFKRKEMWQTFIAAEQVKGDKTKLAEPIAIVRNAVSYTKRDETTNVHEHIKALSGIVPDNDIEGNEIIKKLKIFAKNPELLEKNKELFFKELKKFEEHEITVSSDKRTAEALQEYKDINIQAIERKVNDTDTGALQKMLSIYYKIAPYELEKSGAMPALKRAVKSFDKSFYYESSEYFDKVRDLRLGSAPTDVLTILLSFITLTYGFGHAKDKDKKTSIMLKSGIPIVGGIATATYSAAKLVSGGKSLALGFLSGIVLNQLGVIADNMRKNVTPKQTILAESQHKIETAEKTKELIEETLPKIEV